MIIEKVTVKRALDTSNVVEAEALVWEGAKRKYVHIYSFYGLVYEVGDQSMLNESDVKRKEYKLPGRSEYSEIFKMLESVMETIEKTPAKTKGITNGCLKGMSCDG